MNPGWGTSSGRSGPTCQYTTAWSARLSDVMVHAETTMTYTEPVGRRQCRRHCRLLPVGVVICVWRLRLLATVHIANQCCCGVALMPEDKEDCKPHQSEASDTANDPSGNTPGVGLCLGPRTGIIASRSGQCCSITGSGQLGARDQARGLA